MPHKPRMVWNVCQICKRPYQAEAYKINIRRSKTCSPSCSVRLPRKRTSQAGPDNGNWRGGRTIHTKGYVCVREPGHPRASNGYVLEHILVAERKLGRPLLPGETVHHHNGKKHDNRPENIGIFDTIGDHSKFHAKLRAARKEVAHV